MPAPLPRDVVRRRTSRDNLPLLPRASSFTAPNGHHHLEEITESSPPRPEPKKAVDWEIPRKVFHSSIGLLVLPLYTNRVDVRPLVVCLSGFLVFVTAWDVVRFRSSTIERAYERAVGFLMRDSEKEKVNGVVWYLIGVIFVLCTFQQDIAVVAILLLSWADTAASTFGRAWGRYTPALPRAVPGLGLPLFARRKSLAGFAGAAATGALVGGIFWGWIAPLGHDAPAWTWTHTQLGGPVGLALVSAATGVIAAVAESLDVGSFDDNLTLPVLSGIALWAFFKLVPWFA